MSRDRIEDIYPLSPMQQGMLFHCLLAPGLYVEQLRCGLEGEVEPALLKRAWQRILDRQPALRTAFAWERRNEPLQVVFRQVDLPWTELDWSDLELAEVDDRFAVFCREEATRPFDLARAPLLRVALIRCGGGAWRFAWTYHHLILDRWSSTRVMEELMIAYAAFRGGAQPVLPSAPPFRDYIAWLGKQDPQAAESFWRAELADVRVPTPLPLDRFPGRRSEGGRRFRALVSDRAVEELRAGALAFSGTVATIAQAAWGLLLARYGGGGEVVYGTTVSGRPPTLDRVESMVGLMINTLPVRLPIEGSRGVADWLRNLFRRQVATRDFEFTPLHQIQRWVGLAQGASLFESLLVFENTPPSTAQPGAQAMRVIAVDSSQSTNFPLMAVLGMDTALSIEINFDGERFDDADVARLGRHLEALMLGLVRGMESTVDAVPMLSPGERQELLGERTVRRDFPLAAPSLHAAILAEAARRPDALAVVCGGESLSYGALVTDALALAASFRRLGVEPGDRVGLCCERSIEMIVAILGTLAAGAAYVPMDPASPRSRLNFQIEDSGVPVVLVHPTTLAERFDAAGRRVVALADFAAAPAESHRTRRESLPEDAAYVIYTSGSTGRPKGVVVDHRSALRLFLATDEWFGFGAADVWTLFHSYAFDFSAWEIFGALLFGGKLVVVPYETSRSPEAFHRLLRRERATVLNQTPSAFRTLDAVDAGRGGEAASALGLSVVVFGGEALDPRSLAGWFARHGERTRMINMYGITETTVHVTYRPILPADTGSPRSPIGVPIADLDLYLLDLEGSLEPLPIGAPGEILVGGPGLAQGYLDRPELTAERFVPHPFRGAGERLYRSGDLARRAADGELEILGRIDQQVKVRGFRIELGEIEAVAASHAQVDGAAVVALSGPSGDPRLVLYVASADPPAWPELRTYLSARLPDYMVPSLQVTIPRLPLTVNGKVDRRALPAPEPARPDLGHGAVLPRSEIEERIAAIWRTILGLKTVGVFDNFFDLGATSLDLIRALGQLRGAGEGFARLEMIDLFRFPNVDSLTRHLTGEAEPAAEAPSAPIEPASPAGGADARIAIIGMACRFPGATSPDELWANLVDGVESISFFGAEELTAAGVSEAVLAAPNFVRAKGVIADADLFDAAFFGFNPREAEITDPQHRVFLECVWEALENAGYDPFGRRIGLYCGSSKSGYWLHVLSRGEIVGAVGEYAISIANDKDYLATKASYKLNLRGPSVTVQTACSTSLVATHLACRSLLAGECDLALAGGVSIDPVAKGGYFYEEGGITSRDGHCRAFDVRSGGTVPGNGAGVVVLKRLSDAERDGDPIYAVILGTAINNDGSDKVGYTAPSVAGQAAVIARAQRAAGVSPASISYIEAHGTGTLLGDPIEVAALQQVFGRQGDGGCALGSIKTNLGHLDAAAGVAGLIKASLSLWRESIPASLHFEEPNPGLSLAGSPFYVNARLREWPRGESPRRAGVSSFGIGGTNAHAVLEEAPLAEPSEIRREWVVLPVSGRSEAAAASSVKRLARHLERHDEDALAEVAWTLQTGRRAFGHRRALVARSRTEALHSLADGSGWLRGEWQGERSREVVFAFPGQGVQRFGLGRTLYEKEETFRAALDESASLLARELGWDVREAWFGAASGEESAAESSRLLSRTAVTQPALFAWEYALARQWQSWGVSPAGLVGHSLGEYVAAVLSGVMTLEEGARLVALRGRLMGELPEGGMLALAAGEEEVTSVLGEGLSLAAVNAPRRVVVSGPRELLSSWWSSQSSRGWEGRYLETSHAFHSGMLEPILGRYARELAKVRLSAPQIPVVSNVTGDWLREEEARDVGYWVRQLRDCVRFGSSVRSLMGSGDRLFLEVGPGKTLSRLARQQEGGRSWQVVGGLTGEEEGGEESELQRSLAQVWAHGVAVDWPSLHRGEKLRRVHLPTYPFERRRFWVEARPFALGEAPAEGRGDADSGRWCYAPLWRPTVAPAADPAAADGPWLALVDREERSAAPLLAALRNRGIEIIEIDRASLDLPEGWRAGFARRLRDLAAAGRPPRRILHLWSLGRCEPSGAASLARENPAGLFALFEILRALNRELSGREIGLDVVTSGALAIEAGAEVRPERAALIGPARIFRQESIEIASRLIDVDLPGENERERWADQVADELAAPARQALVGLRRGRRFELGFDPLPLSPPGGRPRLLRHRGIYLITGAFGGVGRVLARELVRSVQARLLLCGTVPLPAREDWVATRENGPPSVVDRLRFVAELEAAGGEVETFAGDASIPSFAPAAVEQAIARFGALHGIVHAAGIAGDAAYLPASETDAGACEVQLAPKALALLHLADAVRERDLDFVLLCSSLATVLGGLGFAAYAAANHALEAIGDREDALGATRWISVAWDGWRLGSGGEAGAGLDPATGAECFRRILDHGAGGTIAVSTSDLGARMRRSVPVSEAPDISETPVDAPGNASASAADGGPEDRILRLYCALLGVEQVRPSDDFFALGGDSLLATQLASRLRRDFAVELPLRAIFEQPTPKGLAQRIAAALEGTDRLDEEAISAVARSGPMPLSFAQRRLWFLDQIEPWNSAFNLSIAVRASGVLRADLLARALAETVRRHESLRTAFVKVAGEPMQVIQPHGPRLRTLDFTALEARIREPQAALLAGLDARRPFDLASGPLLRATLVELDDREHLLALSMHHIVSDGWSLKILFQELVALYTAFAADQASPFPEPTIQYADYADWQRRTLGTDRLAREVEHWQERLAGAAFDLDLAERQGTRAAGAQPADGDSFVVPADLAARLRSLAQGEGVTLFVVSTAAFAVVLRHLSGREDLLIGTDVAGRERLETEGIIGFFINQIVLRADLAGDPTFRELLARLRGVVLTAFAHQELPFEKLVEALRIERHPDRAPLFQAKVNFQNAPESAIELPGLKFQRLPVVGGVAQLDVILNVVESDGVLTVTLEYRRDVLTPGGAARILKAYEAVLGAAVADPATSIGDFGRLLGDLDRDRRTREAARFSGEMADRLVARRRGPATVGSRDGGGA